MNERLYFTTDNAEPIEPIEELSVVRLKNPMETANGLLVAGACGTVVSVFGSGEAYMVEFDGPFHALETLSCEMVEAVSGSSGADILSNLRIGNR